jgi:RimJ/RimL family protein N-acetyltransferase
MTFDYELVQLQTDALSLAYFKVPWDSDIFGFPVAQISKISVANPRQAFHDLTPFQNWMEQEHIQLASSRLPHDHLRESMLLEKIGFRFVEMVLHPHLTDLQAFVCSPQGLDVVLADADDMVLIEEIAAHAFGHERFHADPRLSRDLANHRYSIWVRNSYSHSTQQLYKICDGPDLVAFFVTEDRPDGECYWHLTAIAPAFQGRGYGKRVWREMLYFHQQHGMQSIVTTIAARNTPVLNLYASLGFRFQPPEFTLHWLRDV